MSSTGDALIGQTLDGRYRVLSRIAEGGMATVYLAVDERLEREVALKVMRPHLVHDESFVSRFRREARSAAALSHPNVVAVFDQGQDGGSVFLAMEYVPGQTLREVLTDEGPLSPRAAFDVLDPVLQALGAAHAKGLIHRDVKPENVILSETGAVKVADFGLARAVSSQTMTSSTGVLLGTVAYLSPEQVERGIADARSDVYAAGLVLLEMLTGTKAFTGDTPIHVAYQHVHGGVPVPSSRVASLPPEIDDLVAVATARDPDERPVDASELLAMVRRTRAGLSAEVLDGRPEGAAAVEAAAVPTATAALPVGPRPGRAAVLPRDGETAALHVPAAPLEGVVVGGGGRRRRNWWPAALASVLLAAATAWFFLLGPGATATVPSVLNRPEAQAVTAVQQASLDPSVVGAFSEDVAAGTVISVDPRVGATVSRGTEVVLTVSKGPERYSVPKVQGMTVAEATRQLEENSLALGKVTRVYSETVPNGQVVSNEPAAGASVKRGTPVAVSVSRGRRPITVKDYTGTKAEAATQALTQLGLKVDAGTQENSDTVPKGSVISQSPRDGILYQGDTVTLVVSKGPVMVDVPNVVGKQTGEARTILEGLGFAVKVEKALGGFFGTVRFQDPADGQAPKGSTVTITIV
ncbi:Stk1 family PASTA domain-containing Ser/Thr kinase [Phycicoccus duodecadis]|uniref:Stk1 family PASTA domain-containing Ser/Thr kinase n=1 Tax=Phycicoccus duodecadis TaxID=173053 RepID=UPI001FE749F5|nr:Stk1 family PASTA domain-containing Ser/Thr kinase [Phycicoccus duodecadis]